MDERLKLNGTFTLDDAQFTAAKIQNEVGQLSLRGQGLTREARSGQGADVRSTMQSDFTMADAVITLPDLKYTVPGAEIDLKGTYGIKGGLLSFTGKAKTDASRLPDGGRMEGSALLKPADRFFEKDGAGGRKCSSTWTAHEEDPRFGVDVGADKVYQAAASGAAALRRRRRLRRPRDLSRRNR